jgi:hypothetical protein
VEVKSQILTSILDLWKKAGRNRKTQLAQQNLKEKDDTKNTKKKKEQQKTESEKECKKRKRRKLQDRNRNIESKIFRGESGLKWAPHLRSIWNDHFDIVKEENPKIKLSFLNKSLAWVNRKFEELLFFFSRTIKETGTNLILEEYLKVHSTHSIQVLAVTL